MASGVQGFSKTAAFCSLRSSQLSLKALYQLFPIKPACAGAEGFLVLRQNALPVVMCHPRFNAEIPNQQTNEIFYTETASREMGSCEISATCVPYDMQMRPFQFGCGFGVPMEFEDVVKLIRFFGKKGVSVPGRTCLIFFSLVAGNQESLSDRHVERIAALSLQFYRGFIEEELSILLGVSEEECICDDRQRFAKKIGEITLCFACGSTGHASYLR